VPARVRHAAERRGRGCAAPFDQVAALQYLQDGGVTPHTSRARARHTAARMLAGRLPQDGGGLRVVDGVALRDHHGAVTRGYGPHVHCLGCKQAGRAEGGITAGCERQQSRLAVGVRTAQRAPPGAQVQATQWW
jgi:hypothetical protein